MIREVSNRTLTYADDILDTFSGICQNVGELHDPFLTYAGFLLVTRPTDDPNLTQGQCLNQQCIGGALLVSIGFEIRFPQISRAEREKVPEPVMDKLGRADRTFRFPI